ncbi:MAG TPA: amino acid adenylation domain-containing protein, partial [Polyangiaceae bacterium]|nr:amino acid adenylation domain-containing protein [Polyangiaceae bacterium]
RVDGALGGARSVTLHEQPAWPLTLRARRGDSGGIELSFLFDRSRFRDAASERLLDAVVFTLTELVRGDERAVSDLSVLSPAESRKVLLEWNQTEHAFAEQALLHEPFEARASATPAAVALECRGETLTYGELEARANRLSHVLKARGARPGTRVGICLRRGFALVVAMLAVAKSGAAYVPLEPRYPDERLAFMLADVEPVLLVTERDLAPRFAVPLVVVDGAHAAVLRESSPERPPRSAEPGDTAYVIYTSGSTGTPKGVVMSHRAVMNTCEWVTRSFSIGPGDRLLCVTSASFDLSVYDTFGALGAGATVVIADEAELAEPAALAAVLVDRAVSVWNSVPAALELVLAVVQGRGATHALRLVLLSGDWIPLSLVERARAAFPAARLVSLGGATEAAVWSNYFLIARLAPEWVSVPYGRPIQNCRYHVLDARLRPVPAGVAGELYIGGVCLADGYFRRPELSAERFVADPFSTDPAARLYRSGDLARYFDDGELELLGRVDAQVKIRGYRVELGEVEAALAALAEVSQAVCVARPDPSGQRAIVAYVVPAPGVRHDEAGIQRALSRSLPDFMRPARVVFRDGLPLSANGKLDRAALSEPAEPPVSAESDAPGSPTERQVAAIWSRVLGRAKIRADDDFFALGGHSLLAVRLFNELHRVRGERLPLGILFEAPTVRALARRLDELATLDPVAERERWSTLVPIQPKGSLPPVFCVAGIGGNTLGERALAAALGAEQPLYGLQHRGVDGVRVPHASVSAMAHEFLADIRALKPHGPYFLAGFSAGGVAAYEVARLLRAQGERVELLVLLDAFNPILPKWSRLERLSIFARVFWYYGPRYARRRLRARVELKVELLRQRLGRLGGVRSGFERRHLELQARSLTALAAYRPEPFGGPALLIRTEPERCPLVDYKTHPSNGWGAFMTGDFRIVTLPCAHEDLLGAEVAKTAQLMREELARARAVAGG